MTRPSTTQRVFVASWILGMMLVILAGCGLFPFFPPITPPGVDIPQPPMDPVVGQVGMLPVDRLPGMKVTIVTVHGSKTTRRVAIGETMTVIFKLEDRNGNKIDAAALDRFSSYVSGPTSGHQRVIAAEGDLTKIMSNADGTFSYTFANPFPATFAAPYNDSTAFGAADGEKTGEPIMPGTYTVGIEARRTLKIDDADVRDAGDCYFDFTLGDATKTAGAEVVLESNCEKCHGQFTVHGTNRFTIAGCALCHTAGAEDRKSNDPSKATTGVTIKFAEMIHAIHRGADLPTIRATANSADPDKYEIIGFGESIIDFSHVQFPYLPGGTGFNRQTRNCGACHAGAAQEANWYTKPSRSMCTSCHNDIDWTTGTKLNFANATVAAGTLPQTQLGDGSVRTLIGGIPHTFADGQCMLCHAPGTGLDIRDVHMPVLSNPNLINGIHVVVQNITGGSGSGFFNSGDTLAVTFNILDGSSNTIALSDVASLNMVVSGPVGNYQKIIPATGSGQNLMGANLSPNSGTGPFTYTHPTPIPATYPNPANNSAAFDFAGGWGELAGMPLAPGNYTVLIWAYRNITVGGVTYREASPPGLGQFRIGSAGSVDGYPGYVTDAKCNDCHGQDIRFHGNGRRGVQNCVMCHVGGAEDRATPAAGQTQAPEADTIDWRVMIHKIHYARELSVVQGGGKYDLIGFGDNVVDFSNGDLPYLISGAKNCTACHATDSWMNPPERTDVAIWKVACTSCHDSSAAMAHVAINTVPGTITEACATCHGPGREFSIEKSHKLP
ncbi:MAG: hypothetical protein HUU22_08375 [Phycisphaerae bacterium]|nr:hypothetical protein [Phycisphaerae bacterium]NUQ46035.1 hypothetical protein [Phycisphaerae bacterium]